MLKKKLQQLIVKNKRDTYCTYLFNISQVSSSTLVMSTLKAKTHVLQGGSFMAKVVSD